jgi:hypothetical protein
MLLPLSKVTTKTGSSSFTLTPFDVHLLPVNGGKHPAGAEKVTKVDGKQDLPFDDREEPPELKMPTLLTSPPLTLSAKL